jgi:hypothetical protein
MAETADLKNESGHTLLIKSFVWPVEERDLPGLHLVAVRWIDAILVQNASFHRNFSLADILEDEYTGHH